MLTDARTEADDMRQKAKALLADARLEVSTLRSRRDGIAAELSQLSGVIEALAVPTDADEAPPEPSSSTHTPRPDEEDPS